MAEMINISGLTKSFGPLKAVDDVNLTVRGGEVLGFLGPNGAGKTTTMRMITGFLDPTAGSVSVCGHDVATDAIAAREKIGYLPEGAPLYGDITPQALLEFVAGTRGFSGAQKDERIARAAERLALHEVLFRPIDTLSKGFKRRVGLAQAILHEPDVLILDEPTDGLDPNQKRQVRDLIRTMGRERAIIISTHILEEVEAVCTRAVLISHGRIVFDGTPHELQARSDRHNAVCVRVRGDLVTRVRPDLEAMPGVTAVEVDGALERHATLRVLPTNGRSIVQDVSERLRAGGFEIEGLYVEQGHLDEVFHKLTAGH